MWSELTTPEAFDALAASSSPFILFKHSSRCGISAMVQRRFDASWSAQTEGPVYFVDVIRQRPLSNYIAERSGIRHESPQLIVWKDGKVVHHASHHAIDAEEAYAFTQN